MLGPVNSAQPAYAPTRVIAHRGASQAAPENTALAIERAIELGADAVEIDVQATADGALIVQHDCTLDRNTDAGAVFGREGLRACDLTLQQLRRLDMSAWFDADLPTQRILTLADAVALTDRRTGLLVEVSPCAQYADTDLPGDVARELLRLLPGRSGLQVQSFRPEHCARLRALLPDVPVAWLAGDDERFTQVLADDERLGPIVRTVDHVNPNRTLVDAALVERLHGLGVGVHPWIVNDGREMADLVDAGVDGVITDRPDAARAVLPG